MLDYPALAFLQFCANHALLQISDRPDWLTVKGGSREYVNRLVNDIGEQSFRLNQGVRRVSRETAGVTIEDWSGQRTRFDHVVMATHADDSLRLLEDPSHQEQEILSSFRFERNRTLLHSDPALMPRRRGVWSSWNYIENTSAAGRSKLCVSYWMNELQSIKSPSPLFVTLNPVVEPREDRVHASFLYDHPVMDSLAIATQSRLWNLQGKRRTWFCGAWFGAGFHEDGLQSGLAVAEALGGERRPWQVDNENGRIQVPDNWVARQDWTQAA